MQPTRTAVPVLCALTLGALLTPFGSHAIVPLLPALSQEFGVAYVTAQLSVSVYLIAVAGGQLMVGVLTDRLGRLRTLLLGLGLHAAASLGLMAAGDFPLWLGLRAVQGATSSTGMIVALSTIGRLPPQSRMAARSAYLMAALSVGTMVAPFAGGKLEALFGWQSIFAVSAGIALAAMALSAVLLPGAERRMGADPAAGQRLTGQAVLRLFRTPAFTLNVAAIAISIGGFFHFLAILPWLAGRVLGLGPVETGGWLMLASGGLVLGALISSQLPSRIASRDAIAAGAAVMTLAALVPPLAALSGTLGLLSLFLPMTVYCSAMTLLVSRAQMAAVTACPGLAGTAAGISGALQFGAGSVFGLAGAWVVDGAASAVPGLALLAATAAAALAVTLLSRTGTGRSKP